MAMLAEPRRKQRWTLNPRGKQWSEDPNKFGQKMLEKMGWTSGKGLGAKEQGMTEHVRVKFKDDSSGIGYSKDDLDKQWTHHQEDFNDLLMNLQKSQNMEPTELMESKEIALSGKSLEQKSKQSKARVHYQKFTRGKDVNKYSAKDLANIFGKKTLDEKSKIEEKVEEEFNAQPIGSKDNTGGVVTLKGGNMADYFKSKMPSTMKKNFKEKESKENSESEDERYVGFGFSTKKNDQEGEFSQSIQNSNSYAFENPCLDLKAFPVVKPSPIPKPPRKRKSALAFSNEGLDLNYPDKNNTPKKSKIEFEVTETSDCFENPALNLECPVDETRNGAEFEVSRPRGLLNPTLDLSEDTPKKKRKKDKNSTPKKIKSEFEVGEASDCFVNPALNLEYTVDETRNGSQFEVSRSGVFLNTALDLSEDTPKKKRKKQKKLELSSTEGFVNSALNLDCPVNEKHNGMVFEVSRVQMGLANDALDLSDEVSGKKRVTFNDLVEYNTDGIKKKKGKTKLDKFEVENEKLKRKKKRAAPEEKEMIFVNEALDVETMSEEIQDNELNERKCRKEKRKKNRRMSNLETIAEAPEEEKEVNDEVIRELEVITVPDDSRKEAGEICEEVQKKSKKKKKMKNGEKTQEDYDIIETIETLEEDISLTENSETNEIKKKKNKKKKGGGDPEDNVNGFDKENLFNDGESVLETEKKKKKKKRKSMETCEFFLDEDIIQKENELKTEEKSEELREIKKSKKKRSRNSDIIDNEDTEVSKVEHSENYSTPSKKSKLVDEATPEVSQSPYEKVAKKSKHVLKAMFAKSPVVYFKGSNINEIKGYGVDS